MCWGLRIFFEQFECNLDQCAFEEKAEVQDPKPGSKSRRSNSGLKQKYWAIFVNLVVYKIFLLRNSFYSQERAEIQKKVLLLFCMSVCESFWLKLGSKIAFPSFFCYFCKENAPQEYLENIKAFWRTEMQQYGELVISKTYRNLQNKESTLLHTRVIHDKKMSTCKIS